LEKTDYCCPVCKSEVCVDLRSGLRCLKEHYFPFIEGTKVPIFDYEDEKTNEYTVSNAAEIHDNSLKWLFTTFGGDEATFRTKLVEKIRLQTGQKILITGVGAGNDLPYLSNVLGKDGKIFAQDFSAQMLMSAVERCTRLYNLTDYNIEFSVSDATKLPFFDEFFDAVYHFGGINLFSSIRKGIDEMDRVTKTGGRVVFGDEGLAPWLRDSEYGRMLTKNNPLYNFEVPLEYLPHTARDVLVSWEMGNSFYVIEYSKSENSLPIDIDVTHVGKRGGSIRKRYYGQLEGIDPELKQLIYEEAEKHGVSRVDYLESIIRGGLK
jgi:ubiquinone/menaquinone biosynthesis C-methylase UbiE